MNGNCGSLMMPCDELIELSITMGDEAEKKWVDVNEVLADLLSHLKKVDY